MTAEKMKERLADLEEELKSFAGKPNNEINRAIIQNITNDHLMLQRDLLEKEMVVDKIEFKINFYMSKILIYNAETNTVKEKAEVAEPSHHSEFGNVSFYAARKAYNNHIISLKEWHCEGTGWIDKKEYPVGAIEFKDITAPIRWNGNKNSPMEEAVVGKFAVLKSADDVEPEYNVKEWGGYNNRVNGQTFEATKKYPIGGYAPGNYMCTCCICKKTFMGGDKLAIQCELCALRMYHEWAEREIKMLKTKIEATKALLSLGDSLFK